MWRLYWIHTTYILKGCWIDFLLAGVGHRSTIISSGNWASTICWPDPNNFWYPWQHWEEGLLAPPWILSSWDLEKANCPRLWPKEWTSSPGSFWFFLPKLCDDSLRGHLLREYGKRYGNRRSAGAEGVLIPLVDGTIRAKSLLLCSSMTHSHPCHGWWWE